MITKKTKISKVLQENKNAPQILFEAGMACFGCAMAQNETLEDGCKAHGMNNKEIDELIKRLNN